MHRTHTQIEHITVQYSHVARDTTKTKIHVHNQAENTRKQSQAYTHTKKTTIITPKTSNNITHGRHTQHTGTEGKSQQHMPHTQKTKTLQSNLIVKQEITKSSNPCLQPIRKRTQDNTQTQTHKHNNTQQTSHDYVNKAHTNQTHT